MWAAGRLYYVCYDVWEASAGKFPGSTEGAVEEGPALAGGAQGKHH